LNAVVANPAVSQPTAVDFSPAGGIALVVNMASNDVTLLDAATRAGIRTVPVGSAPSGVAVAPDGTRAYVANDLSRTVSIIDMTVPANASVVGTVASTAETLPPNVANGKKLFFTS
jgi:YVTN family beta-propeller protein